MSFQRLLMQCLQLFLLVLVLLLFNFNFVSFMRLFSYGKNCMSVPEPAPHFMQSVLQEQTKVIYDSNGNELTKQVVKVSVPEPIPDEVFENRGISCDLFDVETQTKAGVQLHQFDGDFFGVPLESRELFENQVNAFLSKAESDVKSSEETINFD